MPWPNSPVHDVGLRVVQPASWIVFYDPNGNTYHAVTNGTDGQPGSDIASQDIWALLNSIDGQLASNGVYHIHIKGGQYTGSATFAPSQNKGYLITGDGGAGQQGGGTPSNFGTYLGFTGTTTSAIDTVSTWTNLSFPSQVLELHDLTIQGSSTNTNLVNLPNCQKLTIKSVELLGNILNPANIVTGSRALRLPSNNQNDHFNIAWSNFGGFDNGLYTAADHFLMMGCEIAEMKTRYIEFGDAHYDQVLIGVHLVRGTATGSQVAIYDGRGIFQQYYNLTMVGVIAEGLSTGYVNVNGAYYTAIGSSMPFFDPILGSNNPYGFVISQPQTTLNGTTAGTAVSSMPFREGTSYKKFIVFLNGYRNSTGVAQTITFDAPFIRSPKLVSDDSGGSTVNTTTLTLPISMGAPVTGWIIIEGY